MKILNKFITTIALICIIGFAGFTFGFYLSSNKTTVEITSQEILERISDKYFVVTKSLLLDEETEIEIDQGSKWSNILWGQKITANSKINVDVGVDLKQLTQESIDINNFTKKISIKIPHAEILNSSIEGKFDIESKDGILKKLFEDTTNDDYNEAVKIMKEQAEKKVMENHEVLKEAETSSLKLLELILDNLGYELTFTFTD